MYKFIESRFSWYEERTLPSQVKEEFAFWTQNLDVINGHKIRNNPVVTKIVYSDASDTGFGGYIMHRMDNTVAQGTFNRLEQGTSSTHRELLAVLYLLQSFKNLLCNETIQWNSDNMNVGRIIQAGSSKPDLQQLALRIYSACVANNSVIHSVWIPREENTLADFYSRPNDTDNFSIDHKTFYHIQRSLGYCTIDRFADNNNRKLKRFNSKYLCPDTEGVNAFAHNWRHEINWLCPPINLIGDTIKLAAFCKARGILMIPLWESSYFYPLIWNGLAFKHFIKKVLVVNPKYYSTAECSVFRGYVDFKSLALFVDFA